MTLRQKLTLSQSDFHRAVVVLSKDQIEMAHMLSNMRADQKLIILREVLAALSLALAPAPSLECEIDQLEVEAPKPQ